MDVNSILTTTDIIEYIRNLEPMADSFEPYSQLKSVSIAGLMCHITAIDNQLQKYFMHLSHDDLDMIVKTNSDVIPFSKLTDANLIVMDFNPHNKDEALSQLAQMANNAGLTPSYLDLYCQLKEREEMETTATGNGIAMPHARTPGYSLFRQPHIIIAISRAGVHFDAPDGKPVNVFFLICAQSEFVAVRLLAEVSMLVQIPNITEHILKAKTPAEILSLLTLLEDEKVLPA